MRAPGRPQRNVFLLASVLALLFAAGCSGFEPYEPRNDRIEGPDQGLVSGPSGEFVIYEDGEEDERGKD